MLNETSAVLNIGLLYLFSFFLGYLILLWARPKGLPNLPFFAKLPVYLTLGLLTLTILLFVTGLVRISGYIFIVTTLFSLSLIIYYHLKSKSRIETKTDFISFDNIVPAALFIITFLHFSTVIAIFRWPPPGDVFNHGLYASILVYNQKVGFTLAPYAPSVQIFPMLTGLHVLSAALSMLTGVFPGEAVFIIGGAIVILIPLLLYSLSYILTHSKLLSLFAFLSTFLIGPGLAQWVFGYFYNGPYPNLFGFLAILLFLIYHIASSEIQVDRKSSMRDKALALVIILGVLFVYPPFAIFPILYLLVSALYEGKIVKAFKNITIRRKSVFLLSLFLAITVLFIALFMTTNQEFLFQIVQGLSLYGSRLYGRRGYAVCASIFYTSVIGIAILVAGTVSIFFVVKHLHAKLALFYLVVFVPVMFSLHPYFFPIFSFILPNRSLMICSLISWVLISVLLSHVFVNSKHVSVRLAFKNRLCKRQISLSKVVAVALIILLAFTPSLFSNFAFEPAHSYSWLMRHGFSNDYDVLLWIHENVQPSDLIMNDYSYTSRYLQSFSIKNVTAKINLNSDYERNRTIEVQDFWRNPTSISLFIKLVENYNISYILVTSERGYLNWVVIDGDNRYTSKPFTPAEYKTTFSNNPCLELIFEKGDAGIYKVSKLPEVVSMYALEFDGVDDYIRVEHNESLSSLTAVTMAIWMNPSELPSRDTFLISKLKAIDGLELAWRWDRRLALYINNTIILQSSKVFDSVDLGKWWHIVVVYDRSKAYIYINGEIDASRSYSGGVAPNTAPLGIGCRNPNNPYGFAPPIISDDICVYNRALLPDEIEQLYKGSNITNGLVLYLPLEAGEGNIAYDQSGLNNHGTIYGATWVQYDVLIIDSFSYRI